MSAYKIVHKILSFFLAFVMVIGTIAGGLPGTGKVVQAASMMGLQEVKRGTDITTIDPDFDPVEDHLFTFTYNKKAGLKTKNVSNRLPPWVNSDSDVKNRLYQDLSKSGSKLPIITYYKVAKDPAGFYYDLRAEVTGWEPTKYNLVDANGNKVPPAIGFVKGSMGLCSVACEYVTVKYTYMIHNDDGSSREMTASEIADFHSYITLSDLDGTQGFKIEKTQGIKGIYKQAGNSYITQRSDGLIVSTAGEETKTDSPWGWVTVYQSGTNSTTVSFFDPRSKSERYEAGKTYTQNLAGNGTPVLYHYYFTAQSVFNVRPPQEMGLEKRVGEKGVEWDTAYMAGSPEEAYRIEDYNEFDYLLQTTVQTAYTDQESYVVTDTLEDCLQIDDAAHVTISDKDGKNVTGKFDIEVNGQTITCSAKEEYLTDSSKGFYDEGQKFEIRMRVHRKKVNDVRNFMQAWIDQDDGYTFYVPNEAKMQFTTKSGKTEEYSSNEVWVTDTIKASLKIEKDAKYDGWKVGDTVEYAVEVTQVKQDGYAVNLEITDRDIPPYLQLMNNQWEVLGPLNGGAASISSLGENGWVVTCPLLQYGDSVVVKFKCLALEDGNGKDTINTARATADNFMDDDGEQKSVGDDAEVWINSPELTVDKVANAYEYQIGDRVKYTVNVRNAKDYTVAQNVVVSDISLPEGLQITDDSQDGTGVEVTFAPSVAASQIGWPVPDGTVSIAKEPKENRCMVDRVGNAWTMHADFLPSDASMTITFDCIATKNVNGIESQNQVSVTAENFLDAEGNPRIAQDDAEVYVNTAAFEIDKHISDGNYEWQVGDHVPFDIIVRNINDADTLDLADNEAYLLLPEEERAKIGAAGKTVARNVVISDTDIPAGFRLDTGTVEVEAVPEEYFEESEYPEATEENEYPEENPYPEDEPWDIDWEESEYVEEPEEQDETIYQDEILDEEFEDPYFEEYLDEETNEEIQESFSEEVSEGFTDEAWRIESVEELPEIAEETKVRAASSGYPTEPFSEDDTANNYEDDSFWEDEYPEEIYEDLPDVETEYQQEIMVASASIRPAEEISVEGIPESYDDYVAGTPDVTAQLNPEQYNETIPTDIIWNLETAGNGWVLKISDLPAGYDVRVHFTCEALEASNGQEGVNIGTVTAENAVTKSDDSEAYINTAVLAIDKELLNRYAAGGEEDKQDGREPYEFRVGEDIAYRVTVWNNQPGSIARNLIISDISLPDGLMLNNDEGAVTVEGIPAEYVNPIAGTMDITGLLDPDHYKETEILPVNYQLVRDGNGWQLLIDNLPCTENDSLNQWGQPVVVTFHCTATEDVNGWEIINTAKASADNAEEVKDSERIWINSPVLNVLKNADKDEYLVGDTVTYTVDLTQEQVGCVARNVVISDEIITEGVKLQKNSIVLLDKEGTKFHIPDEYIEVKGNSFIIHTGMCLIKEQGYNHWDAENGGLITKGSYNPIGVEKESRLTLEYAVEIVDRNLAGQTIYNKVYVNSDEDIPKEDDEEVPVEGAELDIVKESDRAEYLVGETGNYKLTIRELREGVTARQIVIKDSFDTEGMDILADSLSVRLNGEEISDAKISVVGNSFTIETGKDLTVADKMEVFYRVFFHEAALDGKYVTNTATAKGTNTKEERQDNTVVIIDENPSLSIKKTSDKQYYKVGEVGHYTVVVGQHTRGAMARNVIVKDQLHTEGAKIVAGTIIIRNDAGRIMDEAEIESSDSRYTIFTGRDLEYGETFTITYDVLFENESLAGSDILNVARATCDNIKTEQKDPGPIQISDGLTVYKSSEPVTCSLVKNGDVINYHISVKNTSDADKAMVLVKDRIPEYTEYVQDSATNDEQTVGGLKELKGVRHAAFILQNLKAGEERTVSFAVNVKDAPQDGMILNVAQVRETKAAMDDISEDTWNHPGFRNTNETVHYLDTRWIKDSNTVRIDGGSLSIEKTSDKVNYAVGEIGHYILNVTQRKDGAVSKNVVIRDDLRTEGAVIQTDSVKVTKKGESLSGAEIKSSENGFIIKTNTDLAYGETLTVTYDVLFKEASLAGKTVKNVAVAKGDETPEGEEPKDDNTVTVGKAGLDIRKTSDKKEYKIGDIAHYALAVRTTADDFIAENVIIKDVMKQQGAHVISGTVKVFLDEKRLDDAEVQEIENGFIIYTHENLSGSQIMKVTYDVTMEKASLAGRDIQNAATADADNTDPAETTHTVAIPKKSKPEKPEEPEKPEDPDKPEKPTPTPEEKGEPILTISKTADHSQAEPGSTVRYTIEVKNTGNAVAEDVVVIDNLKNNKAILQKDTIRTYLQEKQFTPKKISAVSSGFRVETGKDLQKGQVLKVTYQVKLDDTVKSSEIRNVSSASAQNADRTETEYTLYIPRNNRDDAEPDNNGSTYNPKDTSSSLKGNVQTGDQSPIKLIVIVGILGLAGLIAYFGGRRKGKK